MEHRTLDGVPQGGSDYDTLSSRDQASLRAAWPAQMESRISELDLIEVFTAAGAAWVEFDDSGQIVRHGPGPQR